MNGILRLAASFLLGLSAAAAAAEPPVRARSLQPLAAYFSDEDYPLEAIRNHEQGAVEFRVRVGPDGRPSGCSVTRSSGSTSLDATTCRVIMERPRFEPARDSEGKPTSDEFNGRIIWRLPDDSPRPGLETAFSLWADCVRGEAAKLTPGGLPAGEVARRAFPPCEALEAALSPDAETAPPFTELRAEMAALIEAMVTQAREALAAPADPEPSEAGGEPIV